MEFFEEYNILPRCSVIEEKRRKIASLIAKFPTHMKFFLDFLVDIFPLRRHLRHSQGAFNGRSVYARV